LTLGERIIALGGLLLFVDAFMPWFRHCADLSDLGYGNVCVGSSGWAHLLSAVSAVLALVLVVAVLSRAAGARIPRVGGLLGSGAILFGIAMVILLSVLAQLINGDDQLGRSWGAFLAVPIAAGLAYGGFLRFREPSEQPAARPQLGGYEQTRWEGYREVHYDYPPRDQLSPTEPEPGPRPRPELDDWQRRPGELPPDEDGRPQLP
jgi:hypothetical protein